jgi:protein-tyrosine phosphatase
MSQQAIYLDNVLNFRDVGSTVNEFLGERRLREGVFYRSARLDEASAEDVSTISSTIGLNTVIDLRTKYATAPSFSCINTGLMACY